MNVELQVQLFHDRIKETFVSIEILYKQGLYLQARYLAFILIDQLSWLESDPKEHNNPKELGSVYFQIWVDKYFIKYFPELSSEWIWESRNAHLHRMSLVSKKIKKNKEIKQLVFVDTYGLMDDCSQMNKAYDTPYIGVNGYKFCLTALQDAVDDFISNINITTNKDTNLVLSKICEVVVPLSAD